MDSIKKLVLKWLGLYDLIDNLEKMEKELLFLLQEKGVVIWGF